MNTEVVEEKPVKDRIVLKKGLTYLVLVCLIFSSAVMVVFEVYEYRYDYRQLSSLLRAEDDLNAEWGRLLIEQQTFGATAQIGTHAVTQLRMYSPPSSDTVVISLPSTAQKK
ncbi:cell division protein FtsL [Acinetobacter sp. ANC 4639]